MTIRPYVDADRDGVLALNAANLPEVGEMDEAKLAAFVEWAPYLRVVEVADETGADGSGVKEIVGLLIGLDETAPYGSPNFGWFKDRFDNFAYIDRIAVAESQRGNGWGPALYADFHRWAVEAGKSRLCAEVNVEPPNPRSVRFHEINGFHRLEEFEPTGSADYRVVMLERPVASQAAARAVLTDNDRGGYTVPSSKLYPFQWNWDSVFVALGWATFDQGRAWQEVERLFEAQWPSGMVPHIIFWTEQSTYFPGPDRWAANRGPVPSSGISQPPVAATIIRELVEAEADTSTGLARAGALYEALERSHRWWHAARDPKSLGVMAITHPWESGRDNLPDWDGPMEAVDGSNVGEYQRRDLDVVDAAMRPHKEEYDRYLALVDFGVQNEWDDAIISTDNPFLVADPGTTAILLRAERDLAWLGRQLGNDVTETETRVQRLEAGFEQFWNPAAGTYCSFDLRTGIHAEHGTSASFLAPYAGVVEHLDELLAELEAWSERCAYLIPSSDPRWDGFEPNRYWRGPIWAVVNYSIGRGLAETGEHLGHPGATEWGERVRASTRDLIERVGFPESFNPVTGGPVGGPHFTWTAAIWLAWAAAEQR